MKKSVAVFFLFFCNSILCQSNIEDAWIFLKDKPSKATFLANPTLILSERALERRNKLQISLDENDAPIETSYFNQLKNDAQITVLGKSKWMNAIHIQATETKIRGLMETYSFIDKIEFATKSLNANFKKHRKKMLPNHHQKFNQTPSNFDYGFADNQIKMLKGDYLHQQGLTGKNQVIALIDGGFPGVNTLAAFQRIRDNNQILGGYNFVDRNQNFYTRDSHGTQVLSTIAGYVENQFVGSAPDATFYLFITEKVETETVLEETLWVEAAEKADSLGVDVINTSLGYTTFDNPAHNHEYDDMDGKTTFISRGAAIAASRGMLVVNAAGNSGNDRWKYIGAPADATGVITVGAVTSTGDIASFSSFGPSFDQRIKPEIVAQGQNAAIIHSDFGSISTSNGTSFSSPIVAGLIACLNQHENLMIKSTNSIFQNYNDLLIKAVFESAHLFDNPTDRFGYGIPNFEIALQKYQISKTAHIKDTLLEAISILPNPVNDSFTINFKNNDLKNISLEIFSVLGKKVLEIPVVTSNTIEVSSLASGIYFLKIHRNNSFKSIKIIKQ